VCFLVYYWANEYLKLHSIQPYRRSFWLVDPETRWFDPSTPGEVGRISALDSFLTGSVGLFNSRLGENDLCHPDVYVLDQKPTLIPEKIDVRLQRLRPGQKYGPYEALEGTQMNISWDGLHRYAKVHIKGNRPSWDDDYSDYDGGPCDFGESVTLRQPNVVHTIYTAPGCHYTIDVLEDELFEVCSLDEDDATCSRLVSEPSQGVRLEAIVGWSFDASTARKCVPTSYTGPHTGYGLCHVDLRFATEQYMVVMPSAFARKGSMRCPGSADMHGYFRLPVIFPLYGLLYFLKIYGGLSTITHLTNQQDLIHTVRQWLRKRRGDLEDQQVPALGNVDEKGPK